MSKRTAEDEKKYFLMYLRELRDNKLGIFLLRPEEVVDTIIKAVEADFPGEKYGPKQVQVRYEVVTPKEGTDGKASEGQ